ncbi:MAG: hypothetical protein O3B87_01850 [bacterium]|nr:hypothetical protein [bacterium]
MIKSDNIDYNIQKERFYSPKLVLGFFAKLRQTYGKENILKPEFKRAREMFSGAISLLGAYELDTNNKFWLQSNNQNSSPDIYAVQLVEDPKEFVTSLISQIEVVDFDEHFHSGDIIEFLSKTKLSPKKSYDNHTLIVVHLLRNMSINVLEIAEKMKLLKPRSSIYFIGKVGKGVTDKFMICSPYPKVTKIVNFSLKETASKYQIKDNIILTKGSNKKIIMTKEEKVVIKLSDIFFFDEKKVEKYKTT